jgi:homoserine acetyltransferase
MKQRNGVFSRDLLLRRRLGVWWNSLLEAGRVVSLGKYCFVMVDIVPMGADGGWRMEDDN